MRRFRCHDGRIELKLARRGERRLIGNEDLVSMHRLLDDLHFCNPRFLASTEHRKVSCLRDWFGENGKCSCDITPFDLGGTGRQEFHI